jgi:NAD(P)-dependent dehydrogenase (short-subunit alcohol dehydrogenase family)
MKENDMDSSRLSGHIVVFGAGGIGSEVVRTVVERGAQAVSFTYGRNKAGAEALVKELEQKGIKVFAFQLDRLDESSAKKFLEDAVSATGMEITGGVDTIGISPNTPHENQTGDEWEKVFKINVLGSFYAVRQLALRMKEKGVQGSIVLITSSNGVNSQAEYSVHYDGSKAWQAHMARTLAEPYARNHKIRINCVAPGWVESTEDMLPPNPEELAKETAKIWLGTFAKTRQIATVVVFFLSEDSSYVVGQNLLVDGGYRS